MKAMIFAAGLGSRLKPVTDTIPKALVRVGGKTMLEIVAGKLINTGVNQIIINIHHHSGQMREFISGLDFPGVNIIISDETNMLLDTGGGLLNARQWLEGSSPFFIYNVDVISNINLEEMLEFHNKQGALATLAASKRRTSRYLLADNNHMLVGWENIKTGEKIICNKQPGDSLRQMAFSGIHLLNPGIFDLIEKTGSFPVLPEYLHIAPHHKIMCYEHDPTLWADIGTPEKLDAARQLYDKNPGKFI